MSVPRDTPAGRSAGDDEINGLGAFAFLIRLDIERDALSFSQRLEPSPLDRGDVHEHVTSTVVRLDEAVATLSIEDLPLPCHCHWEPPNPKDLAPPRPTTRRLGRTFVSGQKASAIKASVSPPAPTGGGTSKPIA